MSVALEELVGLCKAQKIGNSIYLLVPSEVVDHAHIKQGKEFEIRYNRQAVTIFYRPKLKGVASS